MGTGDWDVVEGIGYPYVAKGHLLSGQVREKEGGMWFGTILGGGKTQRYYGPPIHGLKWTDT